MLLLRLLVLILLGTSGCNSKKQSNNSLHIGGINTETSDMVIADSAAKQTRGINVSGSWIVPNHMILENLEDAPHIKYFKQLLNKSSLLKLLDSKGPFTLFIPTDEAFKKLGSARLNQILNEKDPDKQEELLKRHLVSGKIIAADLDNNVVMKAASGAEINAQNTGQSIYLNGAKILIKDGISNNGVIHFIDQVLLPANQ